MGRIIMKWILNKEGGVVWTRIMSNNRGQFQVPESMEMNLLVP
jgi:hypothetical protein